MHDRTTALITVTVVFLGMGLIGARSQEPDKNDKARKKPISQAELLERFDRLTPAARLQFFLKIAKADKEFQAAARNDLVAMIQERGSLEGARVSDVICRVYARNTSGVATTIKWVIDDGSQVKKGDKLIALDDSALKEDLRDQKIKVETALAAKRKAADELDLQRKDNRINVGCADIDARIAELEVKKYPGNDPIEKKILELRAERARLEMERAKARAKTKEKQAESALRVQEAVADLEATRLGEIEEEIRKCKLVAPQDGLAVYYIPESTRGGFGRQALIEVGEQVREGQKLIYVCKPGRWNVQTRVHEARISEVRKGQTAGIRVDAFPDKVLRGKVQGIATVASPQDWLSADVKLYPVIVSIEDVLPTLKPGLSATVAILIDSKPQVLQVPVQADVRSGKASYCYVKIGKEIHKRKVVTGLRTDLAVEIKEGVKEGEQILRDPRGLVRRLRPFLGPPSGEESKAPVEKRIFVSGFKPRNDDTGRRTRIQSFGLTYKDLKVISALPGVGQVLPLRRVPQEARYLDRFTNCLVVATTPVYPMLRHTEIESGRFLSADDLRQKKNVIVLGAAVADRLFPGEDAMGKQIVIARHGYTVIGILQEHEEVDDIPLEAVDNSVFLPLSTYQVRFGERVIVRQSGSFSGEKVQLNDIYLTAFADDLPATVENIRTVLEENHAKKDWTIQVAE
jgi:multidrug efflux pump subunit AcrA (membrane-fusion protein)